jgi:hypothetical protein
VIGRRLELVALCSVVATLPFYLFAWSVGGQSVSPTEAAILLATALVGGRRLIGGARRAGPHPIEAPTPNLTGALTPQPPPLRGANIGCADVPTVGEGETACTSGTAPRSRAQGAGPGVRVAWEGADGCP